MTPAAAALAVAIGVGMGLLGGGGSLIAVPAFTAFLHLAPKDAIVTSLAVVGLAAAAGAIGGLVRGVVPIRTALTVGLSSTIGAFGGSLAGARLSDQAQLAILAAVMIAGAIALWRQPGGAPVTRSPSHPRRGGTGHSRTALGLLGVAIGGLTGLVGVGGGFLIVPALVIGAGLTMQQAAATSLFVIALAAFAGLAGYLRAATPAWSFILPFAAVAAAGTIGGGVVANRLPQRRLQQAFAVSLVILASLVLIRL
jgi:uncharacterized membrane protein YfcA